jgi:HD superfamily phosphohydrolase YqeK/DNA-directed RNA polymerase subunit RPC12/RpoP
MEHAFCPGSRLLRQPAPELYPCPNCGTEVEIWSDELKRVCPSCKKTVLRPGGMSCLEWCKFGKDCVGEATFQSYQRDRAVGMKQRLLEALERHFGEDRRRIEHAREVLAEAEELMKSEEAEWHIVVPAALLHDVGIKLAEEKHGSAEPRYQEREGPAAARGILLKLGFQMRDIEEICDIVGHHHSPRAQETANFRVLYDADCLVNLRQDAAGRSPAELLKLIEGRFLTAAGRQRAGELYRNPLG